MPRDYASRYYMEVSAWLHAPLTLSPWKQPWDPLNIGMGEAESRSECRGENQRILPLGNRTFRCIATTVMRSSLFCDVTQRIAVVCCRRFGTTYPSHLQVSSKPWRLKVGCPKTSETNYQHTLRDIPEEQDLICTAAEASND
jgi:hypothetical protein